MGQHSHDHGGRALVMAYINPRLGSYRCLRCHSFLLAPEQRHTINGHECVAPHGTGWPPTIKDHNVVWCGHCQTPIGIVDGDRPADNQVKLYRERHRDDTNNECALALQFDPDDKGMNR